MYAIAAAIIYVGRTPSVVIEGIIAMVARLMIQFRSPLKRPDQLYAGMHVDDE